ncbi:MAG TPA: SpoIIE family protein phosphatase [Candidatus Acidoferrum sp.]|nr:SpoIIE family protein phosphatase [Candidatus Acidoferrum sp.]
MDTTTQSYLHSELERRRVSLQAATSTGVTDASLRQLIHSVDEALERLHAGTFGICEVCHDTIEADRLLCNPLLRFCLDHLSTEEQRALERDLVLAAGIQRQLLPRTDWSLGNWQARYHYAPASVVSGDYFDLIESDGGFLFLLGDVAGKGVAASMLMSHLHATFRTLAEQKLAIGELACTANRLFCDSTTAGQYVTLVMGRGWPDGRVEYASAGHLPLLHVSQGGVTARQATGVPLGMFCTAEFPVCQLQMTPGDTLFLYTDGLSEIFDAKGDEYGVRRVESLVARHANRAPEAMLAACLEEIGSFAAGVKRTDDLTLLVMRHAE